MKQTEKEFDSVEMMRKIRNELSEKFQQMNFEEQKEYIKQELAKAKKKEISKKD